VPGTGDAGGDRRRGREHERAGAADQEQREGLVEPGNEGLGEKERGKGGDQYRQGHDPRGVVAGEAVDGPHPGAFLRARRLHHAGDPGHRALGRRAGHPDHEVPLEQHGAGVDGVALGLGDGAGLAGEHRLVHRAPPLDDLAV